MTDRRLLPCPFCGSSDLRVPRRVTRSMQVTCNHCGAEGPVYDFAGGADSLEIAVAFTIEIFNARRLAPESPHG